MDWMDCDGEPDGTRVSDRVLENDFVLVRVELSDAELSAVGVKRLEVGVIE